MTDGLLTNAADLGAAARATPIVRTGQRPPRLLVDQTHVGRHVTGVERVALELFSAAAMAPAAVERVTTRGLPRMIAAQQAAFAMRGARDRDALFMFPGFPPSPLSVLALGDRCLMYVHDTFPVTRRDELPRRARLYTAPSFAFALRRVRHFFVNSFTTGHDLRRLVRPDALVALLRPPVRDVFGLADAVPRPRASGPLRLIAIGTIEPRKNYAAAIEIVRRLISAGTPAELHIVGREGWGEHPWIMDRPDFLRLHGYLADEEMRAVIAGADLLLSTSKAEGLGLPLLEVQHGGLPVIAPQGEVFEEVLGQSAVLIDPADPADAVQRIQTFAGSPMRLAAARQTARDNIVRWNVLAKGDAERFRTFLVRGANAYNDMPNGSIS